MKLEPPQEAKSLVTAIPAINHLTKVSFRGVDSLWSS